MKSWAGRVSATIGRSTLRRLLVGVRCMGTPVPIGPRFPSDARKRYSARMGPDTEALGERSNIPAVTQSEIAATVAAFLGKDFHESSPDVARPLPDVVWQRAMSAK